MNLATHTATDLATKRFLLEMAITHYNEAVDECRDAATAAMPGHSLDFIDLELGDKQKERLNRNAKMAKCLTEPA